MNDKKNVTLGEIMGQQKRQGVRSAAMFMAVLLYGVGLIYTGVHNFNLISRTVQADQQLFALAALICLEGACIFLPIAIHFWLAPGPQRMVGYLLYGAEFTIVILNTIVDSMTKGITYSESMPEWLRLYANYFVPATPILILIGVAAIFLTDPSKLIHDAEMAAQAAHIQLFSYKMREAAGSEAVNQHVGNQATDAVHNLVGMKDGQPDQPKSLPAPSNYVRRRNKRFAKDTQVVLINKPDPRDSGTRISDALDQAEAQDRRSQKAMRNYRPLSRNGNGDDTDKARPKGS